MDPSGLRDWGGTVLSGIITNKSGRPIVVVDIDNNKAAILAPGQRTDVSVDWDFVVDGERITKVGPRSVTFLPDGSLRSDEGSLPDSIDPIRPANPEERRAVEVLIKEHPPEPCQLPDPPTTWPSPIVAF